MDHMDLVNRLRNSEAAHAGVQPLNIRSVEASKLQLTQDSEKVLNGLLHMLSHVEGLEHRMLKDLAEKGNVINTLKKDGLPGEKCNFNLVPGEEFVFDATGPSYNCD